MAAPFEALKKILVTYLDESQVADIFRAYLLAEKAHLGQQRHSGEPYISHPLEVAQILAGIHVDAQSIMAAILHDVIEDTSLDIGTLQEQFGDAVAELVDGVSKLTQIEFETRAEAQAENFRKMVLAMSKDIRVILIKLADRLHNMRTLDCLAAEKKKRIAQETLEIYSPIAQRLGMNLFRIEFEDLAFAALKPMRFRVLKDAVKKARKNRREILNTIQTTLKGSLDQEGVLATVLGREKHLYSLYQKMTRKKLSFSEVMDVFAFRVIVENIDACYRVLGVVHNTYKPMPGRFKDYIAIPKANGYQSLHTVLFGPFGVPIEIQIRTQDMHRLSENGIAAHWLYKGHEDSMSFAHRRAREWVKSLLEIQNNASNSLEFIENVKIDLFPDEVYVFTPRGEIMVLAQGATAVDFAYAVHTDIGNSCVATKVNRKLMPLGTRLQNGQTVEIITAPGAHPNPAWLSFVVTAKARTSIRHYLKNLQYSEAVWLGKRLLERALNAQETSLSQIPEATLAALLKELHLQKADDLFEKVGLGNHMPALVARRLLSSYSETPESIPQYTKERPLAIQGTEGMVVSFGKCCHPIPGDHILGYLSAGRGIVIHTHQCKNISEFKMRPDKFIQVEWSPSIDLEFPVELRLEQASHRDAITQLAKVISSEESNIDKITMEQKDGHYHMIVLQIPVRHRVHLARVMRRIRSIPSVIKISRSK